MLKLTEAKQRHKKPSDGEKWRGMRGFRRFFCCAGERGLVKDKNLYEVQCATREVEKNSRVLLGNYCVFVVKVYCDDVVLLTTCLYDEEKP